MGEKEAQRGTRKGLSEGGIEEVAGRVHGEYEEGRTPWEEGSSEDLREDVGRRFEEGSFARSFAGRLFGNEEYGKPQEKKRLLGYELRGRSQGFRGRRWPAPFDGTHHSFVRGDARDLPLQDGEVVLIVTSPPYFDLKEYSGNPENPGGNPSGAVAADGQIGAVPGYGEFLAGLEAAVGEWARVLCPGGRVCCVVGDVCVTRRSEKRSDPTQTFV